MRAGVVVVILARTVAAQPAQPLPVMTAEDREILQAGPIESDAYAGGVVGSLLGFGLGQAVQGRWHDTGWIFTVGEAASLVAVAYGLQGKGCYTSPCSNGPLHEDVAIGAIATILAFRVWELGDAIIAPGLRNQRFRRVVNRYNSPTYTMTPFLAPRGDGALAGLGVRF